ncbi:MAG TPA: MFS transporter [Gemmataceae bacterium]|nr:MFS transporter [Gemmataceae bacterium]
MSDEPVTTKEAPPEPATGGWFNRTVIGAGLTSFLADVCYEMATAVLPGFLFVLGLPAALLTGLIEGTADAVSNFAKLAAGWWGDRLGRRKPFVVFGYALTGATQALFALATSFGWPLIFLAKTLGWLGKGVRGPLRNAILAEAVAPADRGKAFGLHRAGDTLGAVLGPLLAFGLLSWLPADLFGSQAGPYQVIFLLTLLPGIGAALTFALLIRERLRPPNPEMKFWVSLRSLPVPFRRFLVGVGVFGLGDFSNKLLIVTAIGLLSPGAGLAAASIQGALLYAWLNGCQAAAAFPAGAWGDRIGPRRPLVFGYLLGAAVMIAFAVVVGSGTANQLLLFVLLALAGCYVAIEEALESVVTADLVPDVGLRGTAYGVLGTVNGLGDFLSSLMVGLLMQFVSPVAAFAYAAVMMLLGAVLLARVR